jgi:ATP-dependent Lon protease
MIEIGPRATGKTYFYQQISPHSHLVAGGKASVADLFVNHNNLQRGLVCRYDVVVIDEVSKLCYVEDYGISVMKTYMESGEFSRGKMNIKAEGSFVMLGNLADDLYHQQEGDPFSTLPSAIRDDTAFMDRIHACVPGWYIPKFRGMRTDHYGLVRNVIAELFRQLRTQNVIPYLEKNVVYGTALTGRDINAVNKTASGLIKIIHPFIDPANVPPEDIEWAVRIAMAARLLVKEQQKRKNESEFGDTYFSFHLGSNPTQFVSAPELPGDERNESDPLPPLPACS